MKSILLFITFISSSFLTMLFMHYAAYIGMLDTPNERSSHTISKPRGGGVAIVIVFLISLTVIYESGFIESYVLFSFIGVSALVAGIGFLDDYKNVSMKLRFGVHFIGVFWMLSWLGLSPSSAVLDFNYIPSFMLFIVISVSLVWLLNLYNFMDGIDGLAASEAVFITSAIGYFSYIEGLDGLALISMTLSMATFGFLISNWPPAKIFMGDAGSGFLGIVLGGLTLLLMLETGKFWPWLILFGVFFIDATVTLVVRILSGHCWYKAHCSHAYQHAARKWGHLRITVCVSIINCCWLLPMTYIAYTKSDMAFGIMVVAFVPLFILAIIFRAGRK